ncbi:MAG: FMN-binding protein [Ilumatobacteraceae bacterium]
MNNEPQRPPLDDPLLARLERLSQRRAEAPPGRNPPPAPATKPRRRHPARIARLGALMVSCATTGGLAYLLGTTQTSSAGSSSLSNLPAPIATAPAAAATAPPVTTVTAPATTAPAAHTPASVAPAITAPATTASAPAPPTTTGILAFNGKVVNTRYGPVQVQVQVSSGALVEVAVVQYPNGDGKSVRINERALPKLHTEVLSAQSANVHSISGATYTSNGYVTSLQSALDQAAAAGAAVTA